MPDAILYNCQLGNLYIEASNDGLTRIKFHPSRADVPMGNNRNAHLLAAIKQLDEYFAGKRTSFDLALDWTGASDFYKRVWRRLLKIPYGQTIAYSQIAEEMNNPKAVRAVGMANGKNPLPIVVPCHRVIGKNGHLHGFTGGLHLKEQLLHIEHPNKYPIQKVLF